MNWILSGIMLTSFTVLGSSRITTRIKAIAVQGALLASLQFLMGGSVFDFHSSILLIVTLAVKTAIVPLLIFRATKGTSQQSRKAPIMGNHLLLLIASVIAIISFLNIKSFPLPPPGGASPLLIPVALTTVLVGFLALVARTKATNQILGFVVLENGVFAFGMTIISQFPFLVEIGVLLDVLAGIFIMGIITYHINKTFDNIDTRELSALGDHE